MCLKMVWNRMRTRCTFMRSSPSRLKHFKQHHKGANLPECWAKCPSTSACSAKAGCAHNKGEHVHCKKKNPSPQSLAFADSSSLHPMLPYGARLYGLHEFKCFYYPPLYHEFLVVCCLHLIPDLLTSQRLGIDFVVNRRFISVPLFSYFLFSVYLWIVCGIVFLWSWRKWWAHIFRGLRTTAGILKSGYSYFMKCNVLWECKSSVRTLFFLNLVTLGCSLFIIAFSLAKAIKKYFV